MPQKRLALFIPGFLGSQTDWEPLQKKLKDYGFSDWEFRALDLFHPESPHRLTSVASLEVWAAQMSEKIAAEDSFEERVVIGYSLGGRLALELIRGNPSLWSAGIIISAHPGLASEAEKRARVEQDEGWAQKFEFQEWASLMDEWNSQGVFGGGASLGSAPVRLEAEFDRGALALALRIFSLGRQQNHRGFLTETEVPLLWLTGKQDLKFTGLAEELPANELRTNLVFSRAGHRLPMECPEELARVMAGYLLD